MKNYLYFSLLFFILFSCKSTAQEFGESRVWLLSQMNSGRSNITTNGSEMPWQEHIVLHYDGTFTKTRKKKGEKIEAEGSFKYEELQDGKYIKLIYPSQSKLIANCSSNLIELLKVNSDTEIQATWMACDGPRLTYTLSR